MRRSLCLLIVLIVLLGVTGGCFLDPAVFSAPVSDDAGSEYINGWRIVYTGLTRAVQNGEGVPVVTATKIHPVIDSEDYVRVVVEGDSESVLICLENPFFGLVSDMEAATQWALASEEALRDAEPPEELIEHEITAEVSLVSSDDDAVQQAIASRGVISGIVGPIAAGGDAFFQFGPYIFSVAAEAKVGNEYPAGQIDLILHRLKHDWFTYWIEVRRKDNIGNEFERVDYWYPFWKYYLLQIHFDTTCSAQFVIYW